MNIGVPLEVKREEYRVALTPLCVKELVREEHRVLVERGAGAGSGVPDEEYVEAGAEVTDRTRVFDGAELIVKVKEPAPQEFDLFQEGQAVFTFLHLAPNKNLTKMLLEKKITGIAYETLEKNGRLPLLAPMSEIAGRMATLMAAYYLQKSKNGTGVLPTGIAGVKPAKILVLGAGVVGSNAARVSHGLGMYTVVMDIDDGKLHKVDELYMGDVKTLPLTLSDVEREIQGADIVIGAVLVPGGRTPQFISREMLKTMKRGAVIIDVSIDQGGCVETSRPTSHDDPVYEVDGIIHYGVSNMPGAYPRTSTLALANATLPYLKKIARLGIDKAVKDDELKSAINTYNGKIVHRVLAEEMKDL